ncbi:hypothetical protein, partial [Alistipes putredinis]|uniref:hypothetical protein n=1 Tax=Alistipes putredinis TaxID=28117 RepID=UPI003AEFFC16
LRAALSGSNSPTSETKLLSHDFDAPFENRQASADLRKNKETRGVRRNASDLPEIPHAFSQN